MNSPQFVLEAVLSQRRISCLRRRQGSQRSHLLPSLLDFTAFYEDPQQIYHTAHSLKTSEMYKYKSNKQIRVRNN
ncbi:hypothetical protein FGO68_gene6938 [Halteria grandinella]|uniref:Uncharacterized protein n=1 Tax=Halteria grandinella TaxID=5974 RepID=A0A8J8T7W4_HALGN|nr:hypothetical protein FGO68_gene6938 [Halteria grandinella]